MMTSVGLVHVGIWLDDQDLAMLMMSSSFARASLVYLMEKRKAAASKTFGICNEFHFSPDSKYMIISSRKTYESNENSSFSLWHVEDGTRSSKSMPTSLTPHVHFLTSSLVILVDSNSQIIVWDIEKECVIRTLNVRCPVDAYTVFYTCLNGQFFVIRNNLMNHMEIWDRFTWQIVVSFTKTRNTFFSPDGNLILVQSFAPSLSWSVFDYSVYDLRNNAVLFTSKDNSYATFYFSPCNEYLIVSKSNQISVIDFKKQEEFFVSTFPYQKACLVVISPDSSFFVYGNRNHIIFAYLHDPCNKEKREMLTFNSSIESMIDMIISPNGKYIACLYSNKIIVVDTQTRQIDFTIVIASPTPMIRFSFDNRFLAFLERYQKNITLWDLQTKQCAYTHPNLHLISFRDL